MKVCPQCGGSYPVAEGFCPMDGTRLRPCPEASAQPQEADVGARSLIGRILDQRYRIEEWIGAGAVGVVYRASHVVIGKSFAVKVLRPEHRRSHEAVHRFLTEAQVASTLQHPNVVGISDFGELPEGGAYYVMDLLSGRSLAQALDEGGALTPQQARAIALQIAAGLAAAHGQGVVHRDLKPDNVFLCGSPGAVTVPLVKLLDFGIARAGPTRVTVAGEILGTLEYMSPEMIRGQDVDARADLYALGVMLFEMLTGTVPFFSDDMAKLLQMHLFAPVPRIGERSPELARLTDLDQAVARLMAKTPEERFADAEEVTVALHRSAVPQPWLSADPGILAPGAHRTRILGSAAVDGFLSGSAAGAHPFGIEHPADSGPGDGDEATTILPELAGDPGGRGTLPPAVIAAAGLGRNGLWGGIGMLVVIMVAVATVIVVSLTPTSSVPAIPPAAPAPSDKTSTRQARPGTTQTESRPGPTVPSAANRPPPAADNPPPAADSLGPAGESESGAARSTDSVERAGIGWEDAEAVLPDNVPSRDATARVKSRPSAPVRPRGSSRPAAKSATMSPTPTRESDRDAQTGTDTPERPKPADLKEPIF